MFFPPDSAVSVPPVLALNVIDNHSGKFNFTFHFLLLYGCKHCRLLPVISFTSHLSTTYPSFATAVNIIFRLPAAALPESKIFPFKVALTIPLSLPHSYIICS